MGKGERVRAVRAMIVKMLGEDEYEQKDRKI